MAWHKLRSVIAHGRKPIAFTVRPQDTQMYKDASHAQCTQFTYRQNSQRGRTKHRQLPVPDFSREFRIFKGREQIRESGTKLPVPSGLRTEPWREFLRWRCSLKLTLLIEFRILINRISNRDFLFF